MTRRRSGYSFVRRSKRTEVPQHLTKQGELVLGAWVCRETVIGLVAEVQYRTRCQKRSDHFASSLQNTNSFAPSSFSRTFTIDNVDELPPAFSLSLMIRN